MTENPRFLLDENIDREVRSRLQSRGFDAEQVGMDSAVDKGATDTTLAEFSETQERVIITHDDDFVSGFSRMDYYCVLLFEDTGITAAEIAEVVQRVTDAYPENELRGLQKVGREWL